MKPKKQKVCVWKKTIDGGFAFPTCNVYMPFMAINISQFSSFKYCPFCGKEIKVKEAK